MEFIKAKTILTKVKYGNEWYGIDYNMKLYRGCSHGCIYCDSRSDCYHIDNFNTYKKLIFNILSSPPSLSYTYARAYTSSSISK